MTATTLTTTRNSQESAYERAIQRAHAASVEVTGSGRTRHGDRFLLIPSTSEPGRSHVVTIQAGRLHCDCQAGQHDRMCMHRAAAHEYLVRESEQRQQLARERAQGEAEEREEARRANGHGGQTRDRHPLRWEDQAPVSMWR